MTFAAVRESTFEIIMKDGFKIPEGSTFICGFHGLGQVGFLSTAHLVRTLDVERVGFIRSDMLPMFVSMENGRLILPFEIYYDRNHNLTLLVPRFQPHQSEQWGFVDRLAGWIKDTGFRETVLLGGCPGSPLICNPCTTRPPIGSNHA